MNTQEESQRLLAKTQEQIFLQVLQGEFHYAPRIAEAILAEAQVHLGGRASHLRPGQMRKILVKRGAAHGQKLSGLSKVEVTWTVDAGLEDQQVLQAYGRQRLRQVRIVRLLEEALEQGAVATQEDLAQVLQVTPRTIKRDFVELEAAGYYLSSRGNLQGIGRGQTHKAQIVGCWLRGETYDQIALRTRHSQIAIQRYLHTFLQVVQLQRLGMSVQHTAFLLQIGQPLVQEYLAIYEQHAQPEFRERLDSQLERLGRARSVEKGAQ